MICRLSDPNVCFVCTGVDRIQPSGCHHRHLHPARLGWVHQAASEGPLELMLRAAGQ